MQNFFLTFQIRSESKNSSATVTIRKTYYLTKNFESDWMGAYHFCKSGSMDLVWLEDQKEADNFIQLCNQNINQIVPDVSQNPEIFVGGVAPTSSANWFWFESGLPINFTLAWSPNEPNNIEGIENCLGLIAIKGKFGFNDENCYRVVQQFVCQDIKVVGKGFINSATLPPKKGWWRSSFADFKM